MQQHTDKGTMKDPSCDCNEEQSCPICKEHKLAKGIGVKFDTGKPRYSLVPTELMKGTAEVLTFGAIKYATDSWQTVPEARTRYLDALYRHLEAYRDGEKLDDDSNLSHLKHAATNIAFLLWFEGQDEK